MKVEIKLPDIVTSPEKKYPYLAEWKNGKGIILFTKPSTGMVLFKTAGYETGIYSETWSENDFVPLPSYYKVILSND